MILATLIRVTIGQPPYLGNGKIKVTFQMKGKNKQSQCKTAIMGFGCGSFLTVLVQTRFCDIIITVV